ncbi:S1 RNA-binding domain-containing protein [Gemella sp. GH3]|uniref:S1 RNA-binding domain-containing protein n=1 Tax=unclassified Gemella TaxID=2624949 RepID=UPI0015CFB044|nr:MULTISPECIES: S1 RNA-binding domain-containing protein [unclassified Gemella]MBF0714076.1 S1 RNA-binding domain-containing protein [Gemella sp. GH3.1]NYS51028.1 S1 RNA-binding domain-containing protein [Gemella sp. GH3]
MDLKKGKLVEGVVTKVENNGLTIQLPNNLIGFLAKENMHISKKKKLTDVFSLGYVIKANILLKKENHYTLTQKKENIIDSVEDNPQKNFNIKSEQNKATKKQKNKDKKISSDKVGKKLQSKENIVELKKYKKQTEKNNIDKENTPKVTTLTDLKKLKNIGNLKISVKKNNAKVAVKQPKEEKNKIILDIPDDFVENIVKDLEIKTKNFNKLVSRVKERGLLDEN